MGDEVKITVIATGFRDQMPERRARMLTVEETPLISVPVMSMDSWMHETGPAVEAATARFLSQVEEEENAAELVQEPIPIRAEKYVPALAEDPFTRLHEPLVPEPVIAGPGVAEEVAASEPVEHRRGTVTRSTDSTKRGLGLDSGWSTRPILSRSMISGGRSLPSWLRSRHTHCCQKTTPWADLGMVRTQR